MVKTSLALPEKRERSADSATMKRQRLRRATRRAAISLPLSRRCYLVGAISLKTAAQPSLDFAAEPSQRTPDVAICQILPQASRTVARRSP